jgi:hypothetical protein
MKVCSPLSHSTQSAKKAPRTATTPTRAPDEPRDLAPLDLTAPAGLAVPDPDGALVELVAVEDALDDALAALFPDWVTSIGII